MSGILLIDLGNSNLKWAWLQSTLEIQSAPHLNVEMRELAERQFGELEQPERVLISNVAGSDNQSTLCAWMTRTWGIEAELVRSSNSAAGVTNGYEDPAQLGVDRWLTLLAVRELTRRPACIVDCGTAVTFDVMDASGRHQGGLILPGIRLMRESLFEKTHIPRSDYLEPSGLLAKDSYSAIASASLYAPVGLVEQVMRYCEASFHEMPDLFITGRDGVAVSELLPYEARIVPELVMRGLARLAREPAL